MATSRKMQASKSKKDDEYYTLWQDIADELPLYREQMRGKRIICPCDWDESLIEALVYKEEGYVAPQDLFSTGGAIRRIDIAESKEKMERSLDSVKCEFVEMCFDPNSPINNKLKEMIMQMAGGDGNADE